MTDSQTALETRRRNGKPWSCEPCRKAKVSCDHRSPCSRCVKRDSTGECIYHPAPLTKPQQTVSDGGVQRTQSHSHAPRVTQYAGAPYQSRSNGLVSPPSSRNSQVAVSQAAPSTTENAAFHARRSLPSPIEGIPNPSLASPMDGLPVSAFSKDRTASTSSITSPENSTKFRESRTGFLGPTSFQAVYTDNPTILELQEIEEEPCPLALPPAKIQQGAEVLMILRNLPSYRPLLRRWFEYEGLFVPQPIFREWLDSLWSEFEDVLTSGEPAAMRAMCRHVWENTQKPMRVHGSMSARDWARSASGRNLRWETVAAIMSVVGLIAVNLSDWDLIMDSVRWQDTDRSSFAEKMRQASEKCLCAAYECETTLNETYCSALFLDLMLVECLKGDAAYAAWQRTGEVLDCVVAMGMHRGSRADANTPFFLAELRKRLFHGAYTHDKLLASYLGRPPRCSYRFCNFELPLDLSDEQLCSNEVESIAATLDANGWNTSGQLHRVTSNRVTFQHCHVLEDILELALSPTPQTSEEITRQTDCIRTKLSQLVDSYPDFMRRSPEALLQDKVTRPWESLILLCTHCNIIHMEFLLERAIVNRLRTDHKRLIPISRRLINLILLAQSKREIFRDFQADFTYLLTSFGLTSAGFLIISLYQEEQSRNPSGLLPRAELIPEMSVFISALATVRPGDGGFSVCDQGRRALKRVLDQILSPTAQTLTYASQNNPGEMPPLLNDSALYFTAGNDADFLNWLETVEWDKASFGGGEIPT